MIAVVEFDLSGLRPREPEPLAVVMPVVPPAAARPRRVGMAGHCQRCIGGVMWQEVSGELYCLNCGCREAW